MATNNVNFLVDLERIIQERLATPSVESYTAQLAAAGKKRIAQKVGEEAVELALAAMAGDRAEITNEAADLVYHVLVLMNDQGIQLCDVVAQLEARHQG